MGAAATQDLAVIVLQPEDASAVQELAEYYYPETFDQALEQLEKNLSGTWRDTFCLGLQQDGELVGYLLAWLGQSFVSGNEETVVVIDDLVVDADYRGGLFKLLWELTETARAAGVYGLPVEGFLRASIATNITRHTRLLARLGYRLVGGHHYWDERLREDIVWVRFHRL